jgi:hypothetical protein
MRSLPRPLLVAASVLGAVLLAGCIASPPENVECDAKTDGNLIQWSPAENATSYGLYRAEGGGAFSRIANVTATEHLDASATKGTTYRYRITSYYPADFDETSQSFVHAESEPSEECEVTTIPFFPGLGLAAAAIVGSVLVYVGLRRRQS